MMAAEQSPSSHTALPTWRSGQAACSRSSLNAFRRFCHFSVTTQNKTTFQHRLMGRNEGQVPVVSH